MNPTLRAWYGLDRLDPYQPGEPWFEAAQRMADDGLRGVVVVAPPRVDLSSHEDVRFGVISVLDREPQIPMSSKTLLLVSRVESRSTWCAPLYAWRDAPEDDEPRAPVPPPEAELVSCMVAYFDVRDLLPEVPWRPGTLILRLLRDGFETDPVVISLDPGEVADDPAARTILDAHRAPAPPVPPPPPPGAETDPSEASPALPEADGIALVLDPIDPAASPPRLVARGAFTVPLRQIERTPRGEVRTLPNGEPVAASLPMTLVVHGPTLIDPVVIPVRVDTATVVEADAWPASHPLNDRRARARGRFNLDLGAFPEFPRNPGRFWVRAVLGAYDSGSRPYVVLDARFAPLVGDEPG